MRIAIITDRIYPLYIGGYEILLNKIANGLSQDSTVNVYTAGENYDNDSAGFEVVKVSPHYKFVNKRNVHNIIDSVKFNYHLMKYINRLNTYDVVIISTIPYYGYGNLLRRIKNTRIPIFYEAWYEYIKTMNPILRILLPRQIKSIVKNSDLIVSISQVTASSLRGNYSAKNIHVIPMGIDIPEQNNNENKTYDIGFIGRFSEIKHLDHILNAASMLKEVFPKLKVGLAGDGPLMPRLNEIACKLGIENSVTFTGMLEGDKKYEFLKSIKIFVLPSEREGFSMSTLEAMSCGAVPVVAEPEYSEVFGVSDFVIDGETGLYYPFGSITNLVECIKVLMSDEEKFNVMVDNGKKLIKNYSWDKIINQYKELLSNYPNGQQKIFKKHPS